jgi:hypothetical protein
MMTPFVTISRLVTRLNVILFLKNIMEMSHGEVKKIDINKCNIYTYVLLNKNFEKILKY